MDIAIVAPCPIPYSIGGAENLCRWLQDHINDTTPHACELIKQPSREHSFWPLIDGYRRFAELDLSGFDVVVSMKFPAWMVAHPRHVLYMVHPLRILYELYPAGLGTEIRRPPRPVRELLELMEANPGSREVLAEVFDRLEDLRLSGRALPERLLDFPGPFLRRVIRWLDGVGLDPAAIRRYGAMSVTVAERDGYLPPAVEVGVAHPPSALAGLGPGPDRGYIFTASRLEAHKRVGLLIDAMSAAHNSDVRLVIAGSGPAEADLRERAARDPRITLLGRVSDRALVDLYAGSRAVAFVPENEDYGLITVEAMRCGRAVITTTDAGGPTEFVEPGVTGLLCEPEAGALGAAFDLLTADAALAQRMGGAAADRVGQVGWDQVVSLITRDLTPLPAR